MFNCENIIPVRLRSPPRLRLWFIKLHANERSRVHKLRMAAVEKLIWNWAGGKGGCSKGLQGLKGTIFGISSLI